MAVLPVIDSRLASIGSADANHPRWLDWRWQLGQMLRSEQDFSQLIGLTSAESEAIKRSAKLFRIGATPYYASLMDKDHPQCPIRRQILPSIDELQVDPSELVDPLGEDSHTPAPRVFHKYPDRVLLMVVDRCGIYCRHCNRRRVVGGDTPPKRDEIAAGIDYIARTPRIRDVLLSGGDPLLLPTAKLESILARLHAIPHVDFVRIGTRLPVVCPMRIDDELCAMLKRYQPVYINTHFNHPKELTPIAKQACERLVDAGIPMGNQAVLLRGINSSERVLRTLFRELLKVRVRPYYLFQGDTVVGTTHLRTRVEDALALMDRLRGWMTGMAIPHLVIDVPGGGGKIPITPDYIQSIGDDEVLLRNYRGLPASYPQPPKTSCAVPYDDIYFDGVPPDDDREGSCEVDATSLDE